MSSTLKDVAREAGVSLATASRVLNGKGKFSLRIRTQVYEAAKELGYKKNLYASFVARQSSFHIAVLVHEDYEKAFEWNFIRSMIIQLESVITREGYYPVLIPVNLKLKTDSVMKKIASSGAGAIFSIHYGNPELFTQLEDHNVPVIVINNSNFQDRFFSVCVDDFQGAYEGALHLVRLGHRNIAYIEYHRPDLPSVLADRFIGFKKAIDEHGINFSQHDRITIDLYDMGELVSRLERLMKGSKRTSALFAHDDYLAARTTVALGTLGFKVPDDVSIIAPGDTLDYNQPYIPRITTMRIDTDMLGKLAGEMMINRLQHRPAEIIVVKVKQQLVKRGSCMRILHEPINV